MQAAESTQDLRITDFIQRMAAAGDGPGARAVFRDGFNRLRRRWHFYPAAGQKPSAVFESAAHSARCLAAHCLPLGIAVAMHLYPLCALQCVPIPLLSPARLRRAMLLRTIRNGALVLANAGSDRSDGAHRPLIATRCADGIRIDGTYDYMSLASVADIALFKAELSDSDCTVLCAADLRGDTVRVGNWKFSGTMRLSDTAPVSFIGHPVPHGRYVVVPRDAGLRCVSDYQRAWFHLFLADLHLARLDQLHRMWGLGRSAEHVVSLNEVSRLREYSLHLLDEYAANPDIESLTRTTAALKLRVSLLAQATLDVLRGLQAFRPADAAALSADAGELRYIKSQPTADAAILSGLGVCGQLVAAT